MWSVGEMCGVCGMLECVECGMLNVECAILSILNAMQITCRVVGMRHADHFEHADHFCALYTVPFTVGTFGSLDLTWSICRYAVNPPAEPPVKTLEWHVV